MESTSLALFPRSSERLLNLSGLQLRRLPPNFSQAFPNITSLDLSDNQLTYIPQPLLQLLTSLKSLNLDGNPLRTHTSLPALLVEQELKTMPTKVTAFITGNGTRDWVSSPSFKRSAPHALCRYSVLCNRTGQRLYCQDIRDPFLLELLIKPKALYAVTMTLATPSKIKPILRKIASIGARSSPPVWLVATEADRVDATSLEQCRARAEALAAKYAVNLVGFFPVFRANDSVLFPAIPAWHTRLLADILAKAKRRQCEGIDLSRLEREASGPVLGQVIIRAVDMGLLLQFQRTLFHPAAVADVVGTILRSGKIRLSRTELCSAVGWTAYPASSYRGAGSLLALLSQTGLLLPFSDGFIIPANAPELPPVLTMHSTYERLYKLPVVLGIGRRLQARLAHISGAQLYQKAVLIADKATVVLSDSSWFICVVDDQALFLQLLDCAESLLAEHTVRVERFARGVRLRESSKPNAVLTPDWAFVGLETASLPAQVAELGQGGGGAVYVGRRGGNLVAVKLFKETSLASVVREVSLSLSFKHPNLVLGLAAVVSPPALVQELVPLRDLCNAFHFPNPDLERRRSQVQLAMAELDRERALVMAKYATMAHRLDFLNARGRELEHIQETLRDDCIVNNLQLPLTLRLEVLVDVAQALVVLHSALPPVLHNDIRSPNVFLVSLEPQAPVRAKLGDFGLAQRLYGSCRLRLQTWQWLAPEVLRGDDFGLPADVFSFGVLMWELLHGPGLAVPYDSTRPLPELKERIIYHSLRPVISPVVHQHFSSEPIYHSLLQLMADCWEKEPKNRPDSTAVLQRLQTLLDHRTGVQLFDYSPVPNVNKPPDTPLSADAELLLDYSPAPHAFHPKQAREVSPVNTSRPEVLFDSTPAPTHTASELSGDAVASSLNDQPWWRERPHNLDGQLPGTFYVRPDSFAVEYVDKEGYQQQCTVLASPAGYQLRGGRHVFPSLQLLIQDLMDTAGSSLFLQRPLH